VRSLSVVLPAWNEQGTVGRVVHAALEQLDRRGIPGEVIVVDDGSVDATGVVVARLAAADARVRVIDHGVNRGYGRAVRSGAAACRYEHVLLTDADGQFDLADLARLEPWAAEFDLVLGYRPTRADPLHRRLNGRLWNTAVSGLFDTGVRDVDCAFKLVARGVFDRVALTTDTAFISTELVLGARAAGLRVHEVPVSHFPRVSGQATGARADVVLRAAWDLGRRAVAGPAATRSR